MYNIEPEAKKMAALVADPLIGLRGPTSNSSIGEGSNQATTKVGSQTSSSTPIGGMGGICNEDIRVPDKMVGLSK